MEFAITGIYGLLLANNDVAVVNMVYALRNSQARIDILEAGLMKLARSYSEIDRDRLIELLKEIRSCLKIRNRYAHGLFGTDDKGRLVFSETTRADNPAQGLRHLPLNELKNSQTKIAQAKLTADDLLDEINKREFPAKRAASKTS